MKKGFTLIELLAVIVILAIIALIASPIIIGLIDDARKGAFKDSAYGIIRAGEILYSKDMMNGANEEVKFTYTNGIESSSVSGKKLGYSGAKPNSGTVVINSEGQVAIAIHNGTYCAKKEYNESELTISNKTEVECKILSEICSQDLIDSRDSNTYKTVLIGNQCWMAEDLRYDCSKVDGKNYKNIGNAESETNWSEKNNCGNQATGYTGLLYQWPVAMNGSTTPGAQGLCPNGWHIPTDEEWKKMEMSLGMSQEYADALGWRGTDQGDQLKSESPSWCNGTTNCATSLFNAKSAGVRDYESDGSFYLVGSCGNWWSSSLSNYYSFPFIRHLYYSFSSINRYYSSQASGYSVRCLLD